MVTQAGAQVLRLMRRAIAFVLVVGSIAVVMRFAGARPMLAASMATIVSLVGLGVGLLSNVRHQPASAPRTAWALLSAALVVATISTTFAAANGLPSAFPRALDWFGVIAAAIAGIGVARLLASRGPGRALDASLEGAMVAVACTYVPWAWVVARGTDPFVALSTLAPVAAWIVVVWLVGRLLFLTTQKLVGYRYIGGAFVTLLIVNALLAGAELGDHPIARDRIVGIALWAYCIWGAAALHPSLRDALEPAGARSGRFGPAQLLGCLGAVLVAPSALVMVGADGLPLGLRSVAAASALLPLLLAVYLIRQIVSRARAEYRAQHDPLTGLPNRTVFEDRAELVLAHARRSNTQAAVLFLDLDRFKSINDSLGHAVGNSLLQAVANRLRATVRETDTVARMGGDEFTIVLGEIGSSDDAAVVARKLLALFEEPFVAGSRELHTSTSVGIALYPGDGDDVETLLKNADTAMYRAKAHGRNAFEFYTADLSVRAQAKLSVEVGLRRALDGGLLQLHYQPQIDLEEGRVVRLEALARWPHAKVGMLAPSVFVPVAEETGLIAPLGMWALDEACRTARGWVDAGITQRPIAVNLSARQLSQDDIVDRIAETLARYDIQPSFLELEITESIFMRDLERATAKLAALRELGVRCSIDDFGTGFSGLSYLADMPIDSLKIDQSFVSRVRAVQDEAPIIEAIIGLGRALGLNVVAEGVESKDQAQFLVDHGCTQMQGYLFSPPMAEAQIDDVLRRDDRGAIPWRALIDDTERRRFTTLGAPPEASAASRLLSAICASGQAVDVDPEQLAALFAALVPPEIIVATPSALKTASMRVATGTFAGLMPLSTGLAAAHALPAPLQRAVASAFSTVGVNFTPGEGLPSGAMLFAGGSPQDAGDDATTDDGRELRVARAFVEVHSDAPGTSGAEPYDAALVAYTEDDEAADEHEAAPGDAAPPVLAPPAVEPPLLDPGTPPIGEPTDDGESESPSAPDAEPPAPEPPTPEPPAPPAPPDDAPEDGGDDVIVPPEAPPAPEPPAPEPPAPEPPAPEPPAPEPPAPEPPAPEPPAPEPPAPEPPAPEPPAPEPPGDDHDHDWPHWWDWGDWPDWWDWDDFLEWLAGLGD